MKTSEPSTNDSPFEKRNIVLTPNSDAVQMKKNVKMMKKYIGYSILFLKFIVQSKPSIFFCKKIGNRDARKGQAAVWAEFPNPLK